MYFIREAGESLIKYKLLRADLLTLQPTGDAVLPLEPTISPCVLRQGEQYGCSVLKYLQNRIRARIRKLSSLM